LKGAISKENELLFLVDTGEDISLLKGNKLIETTKYDPEKNVKVKCIDGCPMETHGVLEARIEIRNSSIVQDFQLDIPCDGILGRDFLQRIRAKVCYESRTVTLNGETRRTVGKAKQLEAKEPNMRKIGQIKLSPRVESIERVPVTPGLPLVGLTNKCEIQEGVILAAPFTEIVDGYVMTIILNTNDTEVDM
jgi:hypothetical protein